SGVQYPLAPSSDHGLRAGPQLAAHGDVAGPGKRRRRHSHGLSLCALSGQEITMTIDVALQGRERAGSTIRVGMIGAGATGRAIALQLGTPVPGIRLVAIANRTSSHGERAFREAGIDWVRVDTLAEAETAISRGVAILTDDPSILCACDLIDIIVEATGAIAPAATVALDAFAHGKHVVLVNAELDSLLGPLLRAKAAQAGVVVTNTDGDEPGVAMTLLRYVKSLGLRPVAAGNIKGMVDYYRNPD